MYVYLVLIDFLLNRLLNNIDCLVYYEVCYFYYEVYFVFVNS